VSVVRVRRLAVVGVGLIGGSCALALKRAGAVDRVVGIGRGRANLEQAFALGVVDEIADDLATGVADADAVLVTTPVGQMPRVFDVLREVLPPDAVVTDGGSTKRDVVAAARASLGARLSRFVPAHPIAGAERSGAAAARADLFDDRHVVVTPLAESDADAVDRVRALWLACRARVSQLTPERHDAVFAAVSHLPHALAYALVHMIAGRADAGTLFGFAAGGFRDFTRIASSSPEMWRDICFANRDALLTELDAYTATLADLRALLVAGDGVGLEQLFGTARDARDAWLRSLETSS
jgi:prephenate dehydrogenase